MAQVKNLIVEGDTRLIGDTNAGNITATTLKKSGGTSSQFLKADGSVDSNTYATTSQIPTVNNATLTIQKNGTTVNSFTANASSNVTANITVPTKVSELTNDSGYTTNTGTVTAVAVGSQQYDPSGGVVLLPSYPSVPTLSSLTLSTTAQAYDGTHTLALPSSDPYTSARTPSSHTHGNIQNGGTLQTNDITIASGDKLVVTDSSDSNKVARTSVSFDASTTTKALTPKGTFETFLQSHQSVVNGGNTASWGNSCTVGTVGGTALTFTMPANPDTNTTYTFTAPTTGTDANKLVITPSSGTATKLTIPYATYAGSASSASSASTASTAGKLANTSKIGDTNKPVYFTASGVPEAISYTIEKSVPSDAVFTDTTYESKAAASGGTAVSLCTTGEKYTWNNKSTVPTNHASQSDTYGAGTTSNYGHVKLATGDMNGAADVNGVACSKNHTHSQYAASGHTHTTTLAADTGTSSITLANGGKYKLTAGGTNVIFTMPSGGSSDIFWATYGTTPYADIKTALLTNNKVVLMRFANQDESEEYILRAAYYNEIDQEIYFMGFLLDYQDYSYSYSVCVDENNTWTDYGNHLQSTSYRASSITSSNKSSTSYYTSIKAVYDYVDRNAAGKYGCTKTGGSGVTSLFCCNGNIVCYGASTSFSGTFIMTVSNFYASFMKSIGGYTLDKEALSDTNKITELAYLMTNSSITKLAAGSGSNTRSQFSYQSISGSTGTPTSFTYGASSSGNRISVSTSGVTVTIV